MEAGRRVLEGQKGRKKRERLRGSLAKLGVAAGLIRVKYSDSHLAETLLFIDRILESSLSVFCHPLAKPVAFSAILGLFLIRAADY